MYLLRGKFVESVPGVGVAVLDEVPEEVGEETLEEVTEEALDVESVETLEIELEETLEVVLEEALDTTLDVEGTCCLYQQTARWQIIYDLVSCSKALALQN